MTGIAKFCKQIDYLTVLVMVFPVAVFLGLSLLGVTHLLVLITVTTLLCTAGKLVHWGMVRREAWRIRQTRRHLIARWKSYEGIGN